MEGKSIALRVTAWLQLLQEDGPQEVVCVQIPALCHAAPNRWLQLVRLGL